MLLPQLAEGHVEWSQGQIQDSKKGGTAHVDNYHLCKIATCKLCAKHTCMQQQSMPNLGDLGTCPPRNFDKLHAPFEIASGNIFNDL